jgi:hypothetical protein
MTAPSSKLEHLLALAVDPAASPEESRTAALIAVKLIRSSGFQLVTPGASAPTTPVPAPPPPQPKPNPRPQGAYRISSRFAGWCRQCGMRYRIGDPIWWSPSRSGAIHAACP